MRVQEESDTHILLKHMIMLFEERFHELEVRLEELADNHAQGYNQLRAAFKRIVSLNEQLNENIAVVETVTQKVLPSLLPKQTKSYSFEEIVRFLPYDDPFRKLSNKEKTVFILFLQGLTTSQIAERTNTANSNYIAATLFNIRKKVGCGSRNDLLPTWQAKVNEVINNYAR